MGVHPVTTWDLQENPHIKQAWEVGSLCFSTPFGLMGEGTSQYLQAPSDVSSLGAIIVPVKTKIGSKNDPVQQVLSIIYIYTIILYYILYYIIVY